MSLHHCQVPSDPVAYLSMLWLPSSRTLTRKNVKSFPSHRAALISLALSQTPVYTVRRPDMAPVHSAVCLFTSQLLLVLTEHYHGGMARLS